MINTYKVQQTKEGFHLIRKYGYSEDHSISYIHSTYPSKEEADQKLKKLS